MVATATADYSEPGLPGFEDPGLPIYTELPPRPDRPGEGGEEVQLYGREVSQMGVPWVFGRARKATGAGAQRRIHRRLRSGFGRAGEISPQ